MKLYEFTVTDEYNLTKSEINQMADETASEEAPVQQWDSFKVVECKDPERLPTGEIRYFFEVHGAYAVGKIDSDNHTTTSVKRRIDNPAASSEL